MHILKDDFVATYKDKSVPFGPLGYITYKRTYARLVENEGRTEEWYETCKRVINGNFELELSRLNELGLASEDEHVRLRAEAEIAYDHMFHLRWLPPGRGLWCSGSDVAKRNGATLTNCYFVEVRPKHGKVSYPFVFAMDMLMLGAGVGFGVAQEHIDTIPCVSNRVDLYVVCDENHRDFQFLHTQNKEGGWWDVTHQRIRVKDSREGWTYALKKVIDAAFLSKRGSTKTLVIDVSDVRASGEFIKGFGGKSSGPAPLVELLRSINLILNRHAGTWLSDVACTDMMCNIGRCVVSGNVRRSAMIAVGDGGSKKFIGMKNPRTQCCDDLNDPCWTALEMEDHNEAINHHRWASNNSILVDEGFDAEKLAKSIWTKGEPGFLNLELVRSYGRLGDGPMDDRDAKASGTNPCGEISLESYEPCNLAEIFPSNCRDFEEIKQVAIIAYRYAKRVTLSDYPWPESQEVVERNRRIGVSISGIQDWVLESDCNRKWSPVVVLNSLYTFIKDEDIAFSRRLQINESIKLTTVKPSGTISLLAGVSPGIHYPYAEYYIRRIQFQEDDPLLTYLQACGVTITKAVQTPKAMVAHFPIKAKMAGKPGFRSAADVSAREQLEFQHLVQTWWADNQVSCTVSFSESDEAELVDLVREYSRKLKSTSFLPYTPSLKEHYPDLPYEPISKEQYEEMRMAIHHWPDRFVDGDELELLSNEECVGGVCPIK